MIGRRRLLSALFAAALLAGSPAAAQPADAGRPIVIGRSYTLQSKVLGDERRLNVWLPPGYADPKRRFPVLVLLDGGEAEDFHHISGIAQVTSAYGAVQELIVVGVTGVDRRHDLTSPSRIAADRKAAPTSGGAAAYRRFLVEEVKPWIAAHYRTSGRFGLIGESLAGLFVMETFLRQPQAFDDYIAASPSLWWDDQSLSREAAADLRRGGFSGCRLWFGVGDEGAEMVGAAERVAAALKAANTPALEWTYEPRPSEHHDTSYDPIATAAIRKIYAAPRR